MSDKVVAGLDLTGTKENPNEAWLVVARLSNIGLEILDVKKTGSHVLAKDLALHKTLSVLAVDSPLSLPTKFLDFLAVKKIKKGYQSWQEVVEELVFLPYDEFLAIAKEFAKEPKRFTDTAGGGTAHSPLRRANPNMLHLTYHTMRTLASLDPSRFFVVPFQDAIPFGVSIMEVVPGDTFKYLGMQHIDYKSKTGDAALLEAQRDKVLQNLSNIKERKALTFKDFPPLVIQKHFKHNFLHNEHAVDALLSCYTAGMFSAAPDHFDDPFASDAMEVLLEGWIYRAH